MGRENRSAKYAVSNPPDLQSLLRERFSIFIIFPVPGKYKIRFQLPTSDTTWDNFSNIYLIITKTSSPNEHYVIGHAFLRYGTRAYCTFKSQIYCTVTISSCVLLFLFFGNDLKYRRRVQVQPGWRAAVPPDHPRRPRGTRSVPRPAPHPTVRSEQQAEIRAKRASGPSSTARPLASYPLRSRQVHMDWLTVKPCCGSGSGLDPDSMGSVDPDWQSGSGTWRAKITQKNRKWWINFIFWRSGCSLLRAEGFSC